MGPAQVALVASLSLAAFGCANVAHPTSAEVPPATDLRLVDDPQDPNFATLIVTGLGAEELGRWHALDPKGRQGVLSVFTKDAATAGLPGLMGRVEAMTGGLRFRPRFPLRPGLPYRARFAGEAIGAPSAVALVTLVAPKRPRDTRVTAILPGTSAVPSNLLRIYVQFSAPMHARSVLDHVRLLDEAGDAVEVPFVDLEHGLWDPECTRLTLFFHPGRVKRDIGEALGPPLEPDRGYTLILEDTLEDAAGARLAHRATWSFRTTDPDRSSPNPSRWSLSPPQGVRLPLRVVFDERLDAALIERLLTVQNAAGSPVPGRGWRTPEGDGWSFEPEAGWEVGDYALVIHPSLEDLAGNAVGHRFEERLEGRFERTGSTSVRLAFRY